MVYVYQFKRLPFGISTAPEVFQKLNEENFGDMSGSGVFVYIDDILVTGKTLEEHDRNLLALLERARERNEN